MKGRMIYIVLSIMLAVTIGHTSNISAYTYDGTIAVGFADENMKQVSGNKADADEYRQNVDKNNVKSAQARIEEVLKSLEPSEWEYMFGEELSTFEVKEGENIWDKFPTIEEDPSDPIAILCQIVEAEAGTEDLIGKVMVANVVLNRIKAGFGDSVAEVVFAPTQFDPVQSGFYYMVKPTATTREAVYMAINGAEYTNGALYFCTRTSGVGYFMSFLSIAVDHGNHIFFK